VIVRLIGERGRILWCGRLGGHAGESMPFPASFATGNCG
jgi:hypothetical protein